MTQAMRLPAGGRVDRGRPISFTFDGRPLTGLAGDTLASALLAGGVHLVGRSFKYHRPRGIVSAGAEEPSALVQLGTDAARTDPNTRATQVELHEGLIALSQNRWPSLALDTGAVNDLLSPLFPAGFYYKTFMWPAGMWMTYEQAIRRAAGLGRSPTRPDPDRYDHVNAHCDVLVVGAGPAGLAAALAAARSGARVILADEGMEPGGSLLAEPAGAPAAAWMAAAIAELAGLPEVRLLSRTTVFGYYHENYLCALERVTDHLPPGARTLGQPRQRLWKVRARQVVLATGAIERPLVFAENDRPGIMLAGAVRTYLHRWAVRCGDRVAVFTNNDGAYRTALDLAAAGVAVPAVIDLRPLPDGALVRQAQLAGIEVLAGHGIVGTEGRLRVTAVRTRRLTPDGKAVERGKETRITCDALAVSGGWSPAVHLFSQSRGTLAFDAAHGTFVPGRSVQALASAGACNGATTLAAALAEGAAAGAEAAAQAGFKAEVPEVPAVEETPHAPMRALWVVPSDRPASRIKAFVDFQNDVTARDLRLALREGYRSVEHVKRYTTTGMGTDQGKTGNVNALSVLADAEGLAIPDLGVTTFRPPYTPVTFGAVAGRSVRRFIAPARHTPMHAWAQRAGAQFENVGGGWQRAWYYPRAGETMAQAVAREVKAARDAVGIVDASTLGKIDIRGRDAATFLNRIYTNAWTKLGIGACRYGLMLGEDGMVKDDGVTTRLADDHFHMTTTTGGAAAVMSWLEEYRQTEWPELKVWLTSVTEQWAVASICGARCRELLAGLTRDIDLSPAAFPHLSMRTGHVAGIPARVFRISFTGELSFEINVPSSYGLALWEALMEAGRAVDITPYGTEAMHVLRAEKGFIIVGQETDGTTTPADLGMDWIVGKTKGDFIGARSLARRDMKRDDRKQLVGLMTLDPATILEEGCHLVGSETLPPAPVPMLGHVTSAYWSPNLNRSIALALVKGGRARMGQTLWAAMPAGTVAVRVAEPVFLDPKGERLHA